VVFYYKIIILYILINMKITVYAYNLHIRVAQHLSFNLKKVLHIPTFSNTKVTDNILILPIYQIMWLVTMENIEN